MICIRALSLNELKKKPKKTCYFDLGEGGEDGDAALAGHGNGGVHGARQRDVDQGQQVGQQPGECGQLRVG